MEIVQFITLKNILIVLTVFAFILPILALYLGKTSWKTEPVEFNKDTNFEGNLFNAFLILTTLLVFFLTIVTLGLEINKIMLLPMKELPNHFPNLGIGIVITATGWLIIWSLITGILGYRIPDIRSWSHYLPGQLNLTTCPWQAPWKNEGFISFAGYALWFIFLVTMAQVLVEATILAILNFRFF